MRYRRAKIIRIRETPPSLLFFLFFLELNQYYYLFFALKIYYFLFPFFFPTTNEDLE